MPAANRHTHRRPPVFLQPKFLALVFAGGMLGTTARYLIGIALPTAPGQWPWATFAVNITGAFLLALLLFGLSRRGADHGLRRVTRLGLGTGLLGSLTTYSTFAVETHGLLTGPGPGLAYMAATVLAGLAAAGAGVALAHLLVPARGQGR